MADQGKVERRTAGDDRRARKMDRRQFVDIGWMMDDERRVSPERRLDSKNRRK